MAVQAHPIARVEAHRPEQGRRRIRVQRRGIGRGWFKYTPGHTTSRPKDNKAPDVLTAGITNLTLDGQFERWFENRAFEREAGQQFSDNTEGESTEDESSDSLSSLSEETADSDTVTAQRNATRKRPNPRARRAKAT